MKLPPFGPPRVIVDRSEGPPDGAERQTFFTALVAVTQTLHVVFEVKLWKKKNKWERVFYLDYDKLLLQSFPIRKLLPEAHVDGVSRRAAVVVFKLFQF